VLLPHTGSTATMVARAQSKLVRNNEIEADAVGLSGLKHHVLGKRRLEDRHTEGHERVNRVRSVLLDKVEASGCNACKEDVKATERDVS